jgi:hypothetical protein
MFLNINSPRGTYILSVIGTFRVTNSISLYSASKNPKLSNTNMVVGGKTILFGGILEEGSLQAFLPHPIIQDQVSRVVIYFPIVFFPHPLFPCLSSEPLFIRRLGSFMIFAYCISFLLNRTREDQPEL